MYTCQFTCLATQEISIYRAEAASCMVSGHLAEKLYGFRTPIWKNYRFSKRCAISILLFRKLYGFRTPCRKAVRFPDTHLEKLQVFKKMCNFHTAFQKAVWFPYRLAGKLPVNHWKPLSTKNKPYSKLQNFLNSALPEFLPQVPRASRP